MFHENGPVQSVAKALRLLGLLMEVQQPLTLAALSEQTGWPKSTIHGLLSTSIAEPHPIFKKSKFRHSCISPWQYNHVIQRLWTL